MLLVLTNGQDATADYLISVLGRCRVPLVRLDTDTLIPRTAVSYRPECPAISFEGRWLEPSEISNVWYRRPERLTSERFEESPEGKYVLDEWAEALEGFFAHIPKSKWMNHPSSNALASHKLEQLTAACSLGFRIPDTLVTQDAAALRDFFERHQGQVIVKPMASGYIERSPEEADSLIYTSQVKSADLNHLDDLAACPTLFQQFIDKHCDVRITVVDKDHYAVELLAQENDGSRRCDIRRNNMSDVDYREIGLPSAVAAKIHRLIGYYGLRFAAIDMAVGTDGEWYFLEINPNGQWAWLDLSADMHIAESFVRSFSIGSATQDEKSP